ncbi:prevent-host-death family protein [Brachybacterium phenoliresistens]|uniref:prevent-host-death family protein n=1 Tax=Brachybacterium phenoliresistens TaxID=396014 RepID=UPI0031D2F982
MVNTTPSDLRTHLSHDIEQAAAEPVRILSRGLRECAVLVSPGFYDRATLALGDEDYAAPPLTEDQRYQAELRTFLAEYGVHVDGDG